VDLLVQLGARKLAAPVGPWTHSRRQIYAKSGAAEPQKFESLLISRSTCSRVRSVVGLEDVTDTDVGVPLRRGKAGVAQKLLNGAKIGPALEQMCREAMAERVGANVARQRRLMEPGYEDAPNATICQSAAAGIHE
jgi:hypothetical protein